MGNYKSNTIKDIWRPKFRSLVIFTKTMKNTKNIVFPSEKTGLLLSEILKKYKLYEISATATFAFVVKKIAIGEMTLAEAIEKLKNDLVLSPETAQQVVNELNDRVVPLGKERAIFEKENREIEKAEVQKEPLPQKEKMVNPYREPLE